MTTKSLSAYAPHLLGLGVVTAIAAFFFAVEPIPQDPGYHDFADRRTLMGIANFWNVASNLPFLFAGIYGLRYLPDGALRLPFAVFFIGLVLTCFGSGYYHYAPVNETLVWDRLAMTISFAGLIAVFVGDYGVARWARPVVITMLAVGAATVLFWIWGEGRGAGDLRPYAVVAILPMLVIPLVLLARSESSAFTRYYWIMIGFYALAKIGEHFDGQVYALVGMSGHALKHVLAACGGGVLAYALRAQRRAPESA